MVRGSLDSDPIPRRDREEKVVAKTAAHLIWFLFTLNVFSYLDRINIGFAALTMNRTLGLTATAFGFASTIFYIGYIFFEIPSNLLFVKFGGRKWLARIMVTWGFVSAATFLVTSAHQLYLARFLLGIAEAGFIPGVLLYMTYWFPESHRARLISRFYIGQPMALALGSFVSGFILDFHSALGFEAWRWLFLIEGLPSIILGVVAYFYLCDRPADAKWLTPEDKLVLGDLLKRDDPIPLLEPAAKPSVLGEIMSIDVWLLALAYFGLVNTLNANGTWTPQIIREAVQHLSFSFVGLLSALPPVVAIATMLLWGIFSDRTQERYWTTIAGFMVSAGGWLVIASTMNPELRVIGLVLSTAGSAGSTPTFWTLPNKVLSPAARPAGIAFICSVGLIGSAVSPLMIGVLRDITGSFAAGMLYVAGMLLMAVCSILAVRYRSRWNPNLSLQEKTVS